MTKSWADTPLGWINRDNTSAYTATAGEFEFSIAGLAVNDTIDVLNIREDLIANNRRLVGDSGDLAGSAIELHYGITETISAFARYQDQSLTVDLGEVQSVNIVDINESLDTTLQEIGFKWTLFESKLLNPDNLQTALSIQATAYRNESDDFDVTIDQINFSNLTVFFSDPTIFSVDDLKDEGWTIRLLFSRYLDQIGVTSFWLGYGQSDAKSGTSTNAENGTIRNLFKQEFSLEESYLYLGASLNLRITPRLPASISYEYIDINDSSFNRDPLVAPTGLPGFLTSSATSHEDGNHTLNAKISYWITPEFSASVSGNLFSNQFLGKLPHFNNPLSESFSSEPYGYIGLELGYRF
ncbi:MAG: hypothetical protein GKR91_00755 [Pseudomonadales bacterium]|nr:hypothetical protein [Pseudomonadales bacterium]